MSSPTPDSRRPPLRPSTVGVTAENKHLEAQAATLASTFGLPLLTPGNGDAAVHLFLEVGPTGLALRPADPTMGGSVTIDFVRGSTAFRRMTASSGNQLMARAFGLRGPRPRVVDATAGLGRDTFLLACLECKVLAIERSPIMHAMLSDALARAASSTDRKLKSVVERIHTTCGDARNILQSLRFNERPEIVYLDPMYVPRSDSALAKKEMRVLRMLVGGDEDAGELLVVARKTATKRVVVKRHLRAPPLSEGAAHSHRGRSVRYDVYLPEPQ